MNSAPIPISACVICLDEEDNIYDCLKSLWFAEEIIVLDSGSTDRTVTIAKSFNNVKVFQREFDNYISQKNHAISLALNPTVLVLDADERISDSLSEEILNRWPLDEEISGMYIPRLTFYLGKWIRHGGWYPNHQLRMFKKAKGKFSGIILHEKVDLEGKTAFFKNPILHYSYRNITDHLNFINRYSSLGAEEKFQKGKKSGVFQAVYRAFYKFLHMYFGKLGLLDGRAGFIIAVLGAYYNFLKYIKLYELWSIRNENQNGPSRLS